MAGETPALPAENHMRKSDMDRDPFRQFEKWFDEAMSGGEITPEAMALATATPAGIPSVRMVLLKGIHKGGFEFYTNLDSRKGKEINANPHAAVVFWWKNLRRQVRAEGVLERINPEEADEYFRTRPRGSQTGAWASHQSRVISDRAELEELLKDYEKKFSGQEVPRPPYWGGFRLIPVSIEFWEERTDRLHDRLLYRFSANKNWHLERLAP
jgi:pyridoxamine 5'-phosphate oxidase